MWAFLSWSIKRRMNRHGIGNLLDKPERARECQTDLQYQVTQRAGRLARKGFKLRPVAVTFARQEFPTYE